MVAFILGLPALLRGLSWGKILLRALPALAVILALWGAYTWVYNRGSNHGAAGVQAAWNTQKLKDAAAVDRLRTRIAAKETTHRQESVRITNDLVQANQTAASDIAALHAQYAGRLRDSDARGAHYLALSQAGPAQSNNLAVYTAKLDKSLVEGRQLVEEFRSTLEQRDATVRALGQQLLADRKLTGENDGSNDTSAQ